MSLNFLALVHAIDADPRDVPLVKAELSEQIRPLPQIAPGVEEARFAASVLADEDDVRYIVLNPDPGSALPIRGWPLDRYIEVGRSLLADDPRNRLVVVGLPGSKLFAEKVLRELGTEKCLDATGRTGTLRELMAIFCKSKLLITNDSGAAHLAALTPIRSIVLFGPETPALYGPLSSRAICLFARYSCSPCVSAMNHRYTRCKDNQCLKAISIDEVLAHARKVLAQRPSFPVVPEAA